MKKTSEIIGLPIISIQDATERGTVKDIIINDSKGAIDYIVVEEGIKLQGTNVIASKQVIGIGEYALTIENADAIIDINTVDDAMEMAQKNVPVRGTRVLSKKGRLIGESGDYYVDENKMCLIAAIEFINSNTKELVSLIPRSKVITFGKDYIVVEEDVEKYFMASENADCEYESQTNSFNDSYEIKTDDEIAIQNEVLHAEVFSKADTDSLEEFIELRDTIPATPVINNTEKTQNKSKNPYVKNMSKNNASTLFEQKQRQFLMGKKVTKNIFDIEGNVLVNMGTLIDELILDKVSDSGKMVELVMNNCPN